MIGHCCDSESGRLESFTYRGCEASIVDGHTVRIRPQDRSRRGRIYELRTRGPITLNDVQECIDTWMGD
jgi:hypothetical protein